MQSFSTAFVLLLLSAVFAACTENILILGVTQDLVAKVGEELRLDCEVGSDYRLCFWEHEDRRTFQVEDVKEGIHTTLSVSGNLTHNQCGIVIDSLSRNDFGKWTCKVFTQGHVSLKTTYVIDKQFTACTDPFVSISGSCYHAPPDQTLENWYQARDICRGLVVAEDHYSDLATVTDCHQASLLYQYALQVPQVKWGAWIGGYDFGEVGNWHWVTEEPMPNGSSILVSGVSDCDRRIQLCLYAYYRIFC